MVGCGRGQKGKRREEGDKEGELEVMGKSRQQKDRDGKQEKRYFDGGSHLWLFLKASFHFLPTILQLLCLLCTNANL